MQPQCSTEMCGVLRIVRQKLGIQVLVTRMCVSAGVNA